MGNKGFTLIELLIVMSIIAILATIAQPSFKQAVVKAREAVLKEDLFVFRDVIDKYYSDKGKYPPTFDDLAKEGYIRGIPKDPFTNSTESWQIIYSGSEAEGEEKGIYDVHSGSDLIALDGTPYNEW
ncbi:MAG: type II secretion system protein [Deltaproteobacteria bacterium]|nr:type II secretion system protein [Deltaproteobacteria bacterium]